MFPAMFTGNQKVGLPADGALLSVPTAAAAPEVTLSILKLACPAAPVDGTILTCVMTVPSTEAAPTAFCV
jgi:hypothetical protein